MQTEESVQRYLDAAIAAAKSAGALQKEQLVVERSISYKGEFDLVTEVDRQCEELIVGNLKAAFPDHSFLAEENDYAKGKVPYKWIIDPVDGTTNYAHGFPWFCVSIALERDEEILLGVIYHCMMDELFTAVRGGGAYVNGTPLNVSQKGPLKQTLLATGFPYDRRRDNENNFDHFINFHLECQGVRRMGSAALDLAYVAAGRLDGYWECKLKPWDVAAGCLLVTEAGGTVSNHAGEPYSVYDHRIVASNGMIHKEMLDLLAKSPPPPG